MTDFPMDSSPAEVFSASRWTQGNFFFPTRIIVSPQRVSRQKSRLFGSNEESIAMSKVASVHISTPTPTRQGRISVTSSRIAWRNMTVIASIWDCSFA